MPRCRTWSAAAKRRESGGGRGAARKRRGHNIGRWDAMDQGVPRLGRVAQRRRPGGGGRWGHRTSCIPDAAGRLSAMSVRRDGGLTFPHLPGGGTLRRTEILDFGMPCQARKRFDRCDDLQPCHQDQDEEAMKAARAGHARDSTAATPVQVPSPVEAGLSNERSARHCSTVNRCCRSSLRPTPLAPVETAACRRPVLGCIFAVFYCLKRAKAWNASRCR